MDDDDLPQIELTEIEEDIFERAGLKAVTLYRMAEDLSRELPANEKLRAVLDEAARASINGDLKRAAWKTIEFIERFRKHEPSVVGHNTGAATLSNFLMIVDWYCVHEAMRIEIESVLKEVNKWRT